MKKYPYRRIGEKLKRLELVPKEEYGFIENDIWHPSERFIEETHEMMLKEYGGYTGYERGISVFGIVLANAKKADGIYRKAAVLLRDLATRRIYQDGNHRTAMATVETFLIMNGRKIWTENPQETYRFIKDILRYDLDEVGSGLSVDPRKQHPIKVLAAVIEKRDEALEKLNRGSKKIRVK